MEEPRDCNVSLTLVKETGKERRSSRRGLDEGSFLKTSIMSMGNPQVKAVHQTNPTLLRIKPTLVSLLYSVKGLEQPPECCTVCHKCEAFESTAVGVLHEL